MMNPAACSTLKDLGTRKVMSALAAARSAKPPKVMAMTRSPTAKSTPSAASATMPTTSVPGVNGGSGLTW